MSDTEILKAKEEMKQDESFFLDEAKKKNKKKKKKTSLTQITPGEEIKEDPKAPKKKWTPVTDLGPQQPLIDVVKSQPRIHQRSTKSLGKKLLKYKIRSTETTTTTTTTTTKETTEET